MQFKPVIKKFTFIVKTEFEAYINSIEFNNEDIYEAVWHTLNILQDKFKDINIKDEFINDLKLAITECYNDSPCDLHRKEIEYDLEEIITKTDDFDKLVFKVNNSDYYFKDINSKIKSYII